MPTPSTKLEFLARSEIDETTLVDSFGAIDRFYELSLQHAFWRYFVLGTYVSYEIADYVGDPLVDQRTKAKASRPTIISIRILSVYGRYEHTDFFTTTVGERLRRERGAARRAHPALSPVSHGRRSR